MNRWVYRGFNLGIEMLFVSSDIDSSGEITVAEGFNLGIEMLFVSRQHVQMGAQSLSVSISESRCFSFQVVQAVLCGKMRLGFNLGIEMLFVSRRHVSAD